MRYTPAQVGDAAEPAAHLASAMPAAVAADVDARDELPAAGVNYSPREARSWRGRQTVQLAAGPATIGADAQLPAVHAGAGQADRRHVWTGHAGYNGATDETLRPAPEQLANVSPAVQLAPEAAPDRPRAGSTGADPARPALFRLWTFVRAFDQSAQYGPAAVDKLPSAAPIASRPLAYEAAIAGAEPSTGGAGPTSMDPASAQPNTVRLLPRAWDQLLVNRGTAEPADVAPVPAASSARSRGWRA